MRNSIKYLALLAISLAFIFTSCKKDDTKSTIEYDYLKSVAYTEADLVMTGEGDFEKVITKPLVKFDNCKFIVEGVIEFYSIPDNKWLATIDFGDGTCDEWATKSWDGGSKELSMANWKEKGK